MATYPPIRSWRYVRSDLIQLAPVLLRGCCRDLPLAIMASLGICAALYILVCLTLTGLVPYTSINQSAPLASAFSG